MCGSRSVRAWLVVRGGFQRAPHDWEFRLGTKLEAQFLVNVRSSLSNPLWLRRQAPEKQDAIQRDEDLQSTPLDDRNLRKSLVEVANGRIDLLTH